MRTIEYLRTTALLLGLATVGCSGDDGTTGAQGMDGDEGADGDNGDNGVDGQNGNDGAPGNDGDDGDVGVMGDAGTDGASSLLVQTPLMPGNVHCVQGGLQVASGVDEDADGQLAADEVAQTDYLCTPAPEKAFRRVASFAVCEQLPTGCEDGTETAAEIVAASADGMTLIYTDSPAERVGFVDITDPVAPGADGTVDMAGEPTSVAVVGGYALVGVNTSADFVNVSGQLAVLDIAGRSVVRSIELGGQPDSVAVGPDGQYAAVVIENERDEDLGNGEIPQAPAGKLVVVTLAGAPAAWTTADVSMTGLAGVYEAGDPEPEFVDINHDNLAVVTLQENNAIALVDLATATVTDSFSAGTVNLTQVDATEEDMISQTESLSNVPREPDGVSWIDSNHFVTADEGDMLGGSRGFTVFDTSGNVVYSSGNSLDHMTARFGHYPEGRSENKGNEPENAEYGVFEGRPVLFVSSERASLVFVYDVQDPATPRFLQVLPAGLGPEGALAITSRNLLAVASEEDARGDGFRSVLNIYSYDRAPAEYPSLMSADRWDGTPIPWSAMSGLAAHPTQASLLYSIEDSAYGSSRIFTIDVSAFPARLTAELTISDSDDVMADMAAVDLANPAVDSDDDTRKAVFDEADLDAMINADRSVNIDPEGIAASADGGFWVASEGSGTASDPDNRPINTLNMLLKVDAQGVIKRVVTLPAAVNADQLRFGFEGVAEYDGKVYVAFQRVWSDTGDTNVRIGIYDVSGDSWTFAYYGLDTPTSPNGGWVGLSDLTSLGDGRFLVLERDNQSGPDAAIKRLYEIDLSGAALGDSSMPVDKTLVRDLMPDLRARGGAVVEKVEGAAVTADGQVWIINDNDGVDDNSGETQLMNLGAL